MVLDNQQYLSRKYIHNTRPERVSTTFNISDLISFTLTRIAKSELYERKPNKTTMHNNEMRKHYNNKVEGGLQKKIKKKK